MLRALSLCSGIGCLDLAATWAGIEIAGQVEIEPFCRQVLAKHWPQVKRLADLHEVQGDEFGPVDLIFGGIPCQPFSEAGQRRGQEDDRYLWPEAFRTIQNAKPAWVLIENVSGMVRMALDDILADLAREKYETAAFLLPACAVGAPHKRERLFIVAHANDQRYQRREGTGREAQRGLEYPGCQLADANSAGLSLWNWIPGTRPFPDAPRSGQGQTQSRLGGVLDGFANWLDTFRWPALPGEQPKAWEPPRIVTGRVPDRIARLKALGNGVVPQVTYPIFAAIAAIHEQEERP